MSLPPAISIFLAGLTMLLLAGQMAHARLSFPVFSIARADQARAAIGIWPRAEPAEQVAGMG
jgi:hypothetical protein